MLASLVVDGISAAVGAVGVLIALWIGARTTAPSLVIELQKVDGTHRRREEVYIYIQNLGPPPVTVRAIAVQWTRVDGTNVNRLYTSPEANLAPGHSISLPVDIGSDGYSCPTVDELVSRVAFGNVTILYSAYFPRRKKHAFLRPTLTMSARAAQY